MKKVIIFGSTGSIGRSALDVIRRSGSNFRVKGLCTYRNIKLLKKQIQEFKPSYVCVVDEKSAKELKGIVKPYTKVFFGESGLKDFSSLTSDIAVMGISGVASLLPLFTHIKYTKRIALASKEPMVVGAKLIKREAKANHTEILPVDSEINSLYQILKFVRRKDIRRVYLTASGGPLFNVKKTSCLKKLKAKDVLRHPTWQMGRRITIDSATLVNKGFEVIETHEFFSIPYDLIDIVIQRESKIHSFIELKDGFSFLCFYFPDMRLPIGYALYYPERVPLLKNIPYFKIEDKMILTFYKLDYARFPLLKLVLEAAIRNDNSLIVINAADEVGIDYFLKGKVNFLSLYKVIEYMFSNYPSRKVSSLEDIIFWDNWARRKASEYLEKRCC